MLLIVGSVVVIVCIVAGYLMEGGALGALWQPAELVVIGGAALGALIISTPMALLKRCLLYTSPSPRDRQKSRMPSSA